MMSKSYFKNAWINKSTLILTALTLQAFSIQAENSKTIEELFMNSLIADAIYVDFKDEAGNLLGLEAGLGDNKGWDKEPARITVITENFELLDFQPDTDSGYSGGIFRHLKGDHEGEVIYASRGTAGVTDDIAVADVYGIVAMGVPQFHLYNYVQRLKTPAGGTYDYVKRTPFRDYKLFFGEASDGAEYADWFTSNSVNSAGYNLAPDLIVS